MRFICPACRAEVFASNARYECVQCGRQYPVLFGIPDFRLRSDRYLALDEERDKARRLFDASSGLSFRELLRYYYSITDDVSPERAKAYAGYVVDGPVRAGSDLDDFGSIAPGAALLDAGCGAGASLVAAQGRFAAPVGVDIALRWLVICRKRLDELGLSATLVCADIESLPFENAQFTHVLATDLLEHVYDQRAAMQSLKAQLKSGGLLWLSAINSLWLGPHPSTGTWAAGYRRSWGIGSGKRRRGYNPLRYVSHLTAGSACRLCEDVGLETLKVLPRRVNRTDGSERSKLERLAIAAYSALQRVTVLRSVVVTFGPAFQILVRAP